MMCGDLLVCSHVKEPPELDREWQLARGQRQRNVCVCVCLSDRNGARLQIYLSLHVSVSLFLWMFSGCTPPVYTMSTLQESSSETLMLIDPSEEAWTQVCCRRL